VILDFRIKEENKMKRDPYPFTKKSVAIITNNLHCGRHVQYFSTIEKYFRANGWNVTTDFNVNKIVICACGFHDAMSEKIKRALEEIRKTNFLEKNIILMACLTKTHEQELEKDFKGQIVALHREELLDNIIQANIPFKEIPLVNVFKLNEKCHFEDKVSKAFHIKISEGCLKECTFCIINKAKGYIKSVPFDKIAAQVEVAVKNNREKIKLMGEDTFAYGIDIGANIIELIEKLKAIDPGIELYFGYLHIRWLNKYSKEILALCKRGVLNELHIGLQHVNDELLEKMGRPVVFSETYEIIRKIKEVRPDLYMVGDILVGFPGETEEMFDELVEFFKKDKCLNKVKHFGYSDVKGSISSTFKNKIQPDVITYRWDHLDKILGERSYSSQANESRIDDETFRITRFDDYSFCKDTFDEDIEGKGKSQNLVMAKTDVLEKDEGDFGFN
jgi:ribosomal protein S12 methylthiotransferase